MLEGLREGSHQLPSCYYKYEKCDISHSCNISHLLERAVEASTNRCQHICEATSLAVQCKQDVNTTTKLTTLLLGNAPTTGCFLVLPIHQTCHECSKSQHLTRPVGYFTIPADGLDVVGHVYSCQSTEQTGLSFFCSFELSSL